MRDLERWKDKVELSLDGRQIFFLFFGSAVAACLVFVVGVLVGKRLEARALALQPPPVEDPLAALDQLGDADDAEGLTFHKTLTTQKDQSAPKKEEKKKEEKVAKAEMLPEPPKVVVPPPPERAKVAENKAETIPVAAPAAPLPIARPQVVAATPPPKKPGSDQPVAKGHFTLQLSAFPERGDAEEFMKKIQEAGYKPFLVASEVPGKGLFYRVRVGDYTTRQTAMDAKTEFERKQRIIAYVARL